MFFTGNVEFTDILNFSFRIKRLIVLHVAQHIQLRGLHTVRIKPLRHPKYRLNTIS